MPLREISQHMELRLAAIRLRLSQPDRQQKPDEKIDLTLGQTTSDVSQLSVSEGARRLQTRAR